MGVTSVTTRGMDDMRYLLWLVWCVTMGCASSTQPMDDQSNTPDPEACNDAEALDLFERKIEPLFSDDHPSTCGQCHLPGVDLQAFARGSACETYACLTERGLVDEDAPEDSLILSWIGRAEPNSELITESVIQQEYAAFSQWLNHVNDCGACDGVKCGDEVQHCKVEHEPAGGVDPVTADDGGCEPPELEALFRDAVYVYRGRCAPCHVNDHEDPTTPMWIEAKFDCAESLTRTFNNVQQNGYLNFEQPERSLLLLKPLAESQGGIAHGGGDKFANTKDSAYLSFKYFIERMAECQD